MSDKNFKVKNGLTIQGTVDTLITADNAGGILVNGAAVAPPSATPTVRGTVFGRISPASGSTAWSTAIGFEAAKTEFGTMNSAFGYQALPAIIDTGNSNTAVGAFALWKNTSGSGNIGIGVGAVQNNTTGYSNVGVGNNSLNANTTGHSNVSVGTSSLLAQTTGIENSVLGRNAGSNITTGSNNTVLGYNSQASSATASNEITLGNASVTKFRIPGLGIDWTPANVPTAPIVHPFFAMA